MYNIHLHIHKHIYTCGVICFCFLLRKSLKCKGKGRAHCWTTVVHVSTAQYGAYSTYVQVRYRALVLILLISYLLR